MFETSIQTPSGSNVKMVFVQCASCGGVIGIAPYEDSSFHYKNIIAAIQAVARELRPGIDWRRELTP